MDFSISPFDLSTFALYILKLFIKEIHIPVEFYIKYIFSYVTTPSFLLLWFVSLILPISKIVIILEEKFFPLNSDVEIVTQEHVELDLICI